MSFKPVMKAGSSCVPFKAPEEQQKSLEVKEISFLKISTNAASQLEGTFIFQEVRM